MKGLCHNCWSSNVETVLFECIGMPVCTTCRLVVVEAQLDKEMERSKKLRDEYEKLLEGEK